MDFEEFWDLYDKKVGKLKTMNRFNRLTKKEVEKITEHLPRYLEATPDKQFRKNPLTYLNGHCWEDEIIIYQTNKAENKVKRRFPNHYDPVYENKLPMNERQYYWQHLKQNGWRPIRRPGLSTIWEEFGNETSLL